MKDITDNNSGTNTDQNNSGSLMNNNSENMLDFDYSASLNDDYAKGLEQTIFVDDTGLDLSGSVGEPESSVPAWDTGSISSTSDYLNIDKPVNLFGQGSGMPGAGTGYTYDSSNLSGQGSGMPGTGTGYTYDSSNLIGQGSGMSGQEPGRRQGALNPSYYSEQGSSMSGGMNGREPGNRPVSPGDVPGQESGRRQGALNPSYYAGQGSSMTGTGADYRSDHSNAPGQGGGMTGTGVDYRPDHSNAPGQGGSMTEGMYRQETENRPLSPGPLSPGAVPPAGENTGTPRKKSITPVVVVGLVAVLIAGGLFTVLKSEQRSEYHIGGERTEQTEFGVEQTESGVEQAEGTDEEDSEDFWDRKGNRLVGSTYADFYTPKCITSESLYFGDEYVEACVVNPESFIGTASNPVLKDNDFYSNLYDTNYNVNYLLHDDYVNCGFYISYINPDQITDEYYDTLNAEYISLPDISERDAFFERVEDVYEELSSTSVLDSFSDLKTSDIKNADISGHSVSYMELSFKGSDGTEIIDVIAFEEKPEGYAFVSEYRCPKSEISKSEDALTLLYEMLFFYTEEEIPNIQAAVGFWPESRIYTEDNSHSVLINVSDFMETGTSFLDGKSGVYFYGGDYETTDNSVRLQYNRYKELDDKSFDEYINESLGYLTESTYTRDVKERERKEFEFSGCNVHYFSYDYIQEYSEPQDFRVYVWLIETPEGEEIYLEASFGITVPDDIDPEEFLKQHITIE